MATPLCRIGAHDALLLDTELQAVYAAAFGGPPWRETPLQCESFLVRLRGQVARPGFHCVVAAGGRDGTVRGFALGAIVDRPDDQPLWTPSLDAVVGPELVDGCLRHRFELFELAVTPAWQRRGIGGRLLDAVLADLPYERAWLMTRVDALAARSLYTARGWTDMAVVHFPGHSEPRVIMAATLPVRRMEESLR